MDLKIISKYKVYEHRKVSDFDRAPTDSFLEEFNNYSSKVDKQKLIGKFQERKILVHSKDIHNMGNNVGIIEFGGLQSRYCLELRPKLDNDESYFWKFLPIMLNTLCDFDDFEKKIFIDPTEQITLPKGGSIVPLLTLSFVSLCDKVIHKGMLKKYIRKTERLHSIKGKIDFANLIKRNSWDLSTIPCNYYDLTFDNPENQIVLWCAHRLLGELRRVGTNKNKIPVIRKLREQYNLILSEISLLPKNEADFLNLNLSGISNYYVDLLNICKAILSESLFSFNESVDKTNKGVNFIIDMDWVFEQYMTHLFEIVVEELNKSKPIFGVKSQFKQHLCDNNKIKIRPDMVIFKNDKPVAIIDFKWKRYDPNNNADFYQVICYGLAELQEYGLAEISTNLFSVSNESSLNNEFYISIVDTISRIFKSPPKRISINKIALNSGILSKMNPQEIEEDIKKQIKKYLINLKE